MLRVIPQIINDIWCVFGNDLVLLDGDLATANGSNLSQQRVIRRLLTNPGDYIWHPDYGAGLPAYVGQSLSVDRYSEIQSTIQSQIFLESSVAQNPVPEYLFQTIQGGLFAQINYTMAPTQEPIVVTFSVGDV